MSTLFTILILIASLVVIVAVVSQPGKSGGLSGAISGGASESAWSEGKGRSFEVILNKIIILAGAIVLISSVVLSVLEK